MITETVNQRIASRVRYVKPAGLTSTTGARAELYRQNKTNFMPAPLMLLHWSRTQWLAVAVMLLTTVHHSYGAIIYNTPWRHHVAIVGVITVLVLFASLRVHRSLAGNRAGKIAFWVFAIVTMLIPVVGIGIYEGGYNHGLKDVLYFSGASAELMDRLFPAPIYEMPNDGFFEITGVLQFPLAIFTGWELLKALRLARRSQSVKDGKP